MTVQEFRVVVAWSGALIAIVAFAVCLLANRLDRKAGLEPEAPSLITGVIALPFLVLLVVFLAQSGLKAATGMDPCSWTSGESWAAWFWRVTTGC